MNLFSKLFNKMSLRSKLLLGYIIPLSMLFFALGYSTYQIQKLSKLASKIQNIDSKYQNHAVEMKFATVQVQQWLTDISATRAAKGYDDGFSEAENFAQIFKKNVEEFRAYYRKTENAQGLESLEKINSEFDEYYSKGKTMASLYIKDGPAAGNAYMETFDKAAEVLAEHSDKFKSDFDQQMNSSINIINGKINSLSFYQNMMVAITFVFAAFILYSLLNSLSYLNTNFFKITEFSKKIGQGDLTKALDIQTNDEFGTIAKELNKTVNGIKEAFHSETIDWNSVAEMKQKELRALESAQIEKQNVVEALKKAELATQEAQNEKLKAQTLLIDAQNAKSIADMAKSEAEASQLMAQNEKLNAEQQSIKASEMAKRIQRDNEEMNVKVEVILSGVNKVCDGDLTTRISVGGEDAIGKVTNGVNKLITLFNQQIKKIEATAQELNNNAINLMKLNEGLDQNTKQNFQQVLSASTATEQISAGIQGVSASTEEMLSSIKEINKLTNDSNKAVQETKQIVDQSGLLVTGLAESTKGIESVLKIINSLAEQTNLLALNATIEAARAGEAGRGFAVVAHEIKELANETTKATKEIEQSIAVIQSDSNSVVKSINGIGATFEKITNLSISVLSAVEEQTATSEHISQSMTGAASGSTEISRNITSVKNNSELSSKMVGDSAKLAINLSHSASNLKKLVEQFKIENSDSDQQESYLKKVA